MPPAEARRVMAMIGFTLEAVESAGALDPPVPQLYSAILIDNLAAGWVDLAPRLSLPAMTAAAEQSGLAQSHAFALSNTGFAVGLAVGSLSAGPSAALGVSPHPSLC